MTWTKRLTILLLLVHSVVWAQDTGGVTLRERLRQRWLANHADKAVQPAGSDNLTAIEKPGDYSYTLQHNGLTRQYRVHVPRSYNRAQPTALLVSLHGGGGDMDHQADDTHYGHISASESEGFVAVFPNGYSKLPSGKLATWNAGTCCGSARDQVVDDVGFIRAIIARVRQQLNVDHNRVYATGMSNGAMMAYRLACEMADTFKAIAAVAGTDNTTQCAPAAAVSVLHIHAQDDDRVLFAGGAGQAFRDASSVTNFVSVPASMAQWVRHDNCQPDPQRILTNAGAYCERYANCRDGAQVQLCVTTTGGHSWPGGTKVRGNAPTSHALNANDVMWKFFRSTASDAAVTMGTKVR